MIAKEKLILMLGEEREAGYYDFLLESAGEKIKNYCNIQEIPSELENTMVEMAAALGEVGAGGGSVSKVKMGDTQVEYETSAESSGVLGDFKAQLNRFRRIGTT